MPALPIAVGVITDAQGRVLIARRPPEAHQGGLWEFPGGKLEAGEDTLQALGREIREELGLEIISARPLIKVRHAYPDKEVLLDVWRIGGWEGQAHGREGQPIAWVAPKRLGEYAFPEADRPIVTAVQLPSLYLISPEPPAEFTDFIEKLEACLDAGARLFQLRAERMAQADFESLAGEVLRLCERYGATFMLNASSEKARAMNVHGVHLSSARLMQIEERPLPKPYWVAASCHNLEEVEQANRIEVDFAVLSPVKKTRSHPETQPLGWHAFERLAEPASFPVYALGGMGPSDLPTAWRHGAQGVAMLSGVWEVEDPVAMVRRFSS
jgi:8-oxo-dGTP diphosphatase